MISGEEFIRRLVLRRVLTTGNLVLLTISLAFTLFWAAWLGDRLLTQGVFIGPALYYFPFSMLLFLSVDFFSITLILIMARTFSRMLRSGNLRDLYLAGYSWSEILRPFAVAGFLLLFAGSVISSSVDALLTPNPRYVLLVTCLVSSAAAMPVSWFGSVLLVLMNVRLVSPVLQVLVAISINFLMQLTVLVLSELSVPMLHSLFVHNPKAWFIRLLHPVPYVASFTTWVSAYVGMLSVALVFGLLVPVLWRRATRRAGEGLWDR